MYQSKVALSIDKPPQYVMLTVFMNRKIQQIENPQDKAVLTATADVVLFPLSKEVHQHVDDLISKHENTIT